MTPLEAWSIISGNLAHLYRLRRTTGYQGFVPADTEAEVIAYKALREMQDREKPELLSLTKLRKMSGQPIWVEEFKCWAIVSCASAGTWANVPFANAVTENGTRMGWDIKSRKLHCYRYKPKEEKDV